VATWIFQGNPDIFDIDEYVKQSTGEIRWLVRRYEAEIRPGDDVFLWRSKGKQSTEVSGIIAKAIVLSYPEILTDDEANSFYKVKLNNNLPETRVKLRLLSIANQKEII
jgi:predicted RNA-binding protein with PUA-like domain